MPSVRKPGNPGVLHESPLPAEGTDFSGYTQRELDVISHNLNTPLRKCLKLRLDGLTILGLAIVKNNDLDGLRERMGSDNHEVID